MLKIFRAGLRSFSTFTRGRPIPRFTHFQLIRREYGTRSGQYLDQLKVLAGFDPETLQFVHRQATGIIPAIDNHF